jgi:hypothetical protein
MKKLFLIPFLALSLFSCDDEDPAIAGPNQSVVGFSDDEYLQAFNTELETDILRVPLNLLSYQNEVFPGDVNLSYTIDATSTAVAGVDYSTPSSLSATLSSGLTADYLEIEVFPDVMDPEAPKTLVLNLTAVPSGNAVISALHQKVTVTLQGSCPSNLSGAYATSTARLTPVGGPYVWASQNIAKTDIFGSEYITEFIAQYYCAGQTAPSSGNGIQLPAGTNAGYKFTDVCSKLKVNDQNLANTYSNIVSQTAAQFNASTYNAGTEVVVVEYTIGFAAGPRTFRSTYTAL